MLARALFSLLMVCTLAGCSPLVAVFLMTPERVTQPFLNPSPSPSPFSQEPPL